MRPVLWSYNSIPDNVGSMKRLIYSITILLTYGCASTPAPQGPTVQYFLSTSQPACSGLKDCQRQCDTNQSGRACLEWSLYALSATSSEADLSEALSHNATAAGFEHAARLLQRSCQDNDPLSCLDLGNLHLQGLGVPLDQGKALTYLDTACTEGVADGCTRLGMLYQEGVAVSTDAAAAKRLFEIGCNAGHGAACALLKNLN